MYLKERKNVYSLFDEVRLEVSNHYKLNEWRIERYLFVFDRFDENLISFNIFKQNSAVKRNGCDGHYGMKNSTYFTYNKYGNYIRIHIFGLSIDIYLYVEHITVHVTIDDNYALMSNTQRISFHNIHNLRNTLGEIIKKYNNHMRCLSKQTDTLSLYLKDKVKI